MKYIKNYNIKNQDKFHFVEEGEGEILLLLHGLFGSASNFSGLIEHFRTNYKVVVPLLPLLDLDIFHTTVGGLQKYLHQFIEARQYKNIHLLGNSLGGHIALLHVLSYPQKIKTLTLTGSSGLFESGMGDSYPRRGDREYVKQKIMFTFYDPAMSTDELVDEVFEIINNRLKVIKIIALAKSAIRGNLANELHKIKQPTLLVWGDNDNITPPFVGKEFHKLIPNSQLHFIDKCGHAPMMEVPNEFNSVLEKFLHNISA